MGVQYYKVCQLVKKLVLAWDPDYTKLKPGGGGGYFLDKSSQTMLK